MDDVREKIVKLMDCLADLSMTVDEQFPVDFDKPALDPHFYKGLPLAIAEAIADYYGVPAEGAAMPNGQAYCRDWIFDALTDSYGGDDVVLKHIELASAFFKPLKYNERLREYASPASSWWFPEMALNLVGQEFPMPGDRVVSVVIDEPRDSILMRVERECGD